MKTPIQKDLLGNLSNPAVFKAIFNPLSVIYFSPSVTPYGGSGMNLGYRIYDIDGTYKGSTRITLDHSTYILNITDANLTNKPKWTLEYSAKVGTTCITVTTSELSLTLGSL